MCLNPSYAIGDIQEGQIKMVYTTETYEDVISHYVLKQNREYLIKEKTKELIELIGHSCKICNTECTGGQGDNNNCKRWSHIIR